MVLIDFNVSKDSGMRWKLKSGKYSEYFNMGGWWLEIGSRLFICDNTSLHRSSGR